MSFWGLVVEPERLYSQTVPESFKVTMAALGAKTASAKPGEDASAASSSEKPSSQRTSLILRYNNADYTICSLTPMLCEQQPVDLTFDEGDEIAFRLVGTEAVHLTGYYLPPSDDNLCCDNDDEEEDEDEEMDSDYSEDDDSEEMEDSDEDVDSEDEAESKEPRIKELLSEDEEISADEGKPQEQVDEEEDSDEEGSGSELSYEDSSEDDEQEQEQVKGKRPPQQSVASKKELPEAKKPALDEKKSPAAKQQPQQPIKKEEPKKDEKKASPAASPAKAAPEKKLPVKLPSGVVFVETLGGDDSGKKVVQGDRIGIFYRGTLHASGKVFDSNTGKPLLNFTVGKGEVIKGLEQGVIGMTPGGERQIVIPSALAYGPKGAPPQIPPNATLVFDVKLVRIEKNQDQRKRK